MRIGRGRMLSLTGENAVGNVKSWLAGALQQFHTRAGPAWALVPDGLGGYSFQTYAANVLRVLPSPAGVMAALREPQSTNLITNSDGFTGWGNINALLTLSPLNSVSPAGTLTADKVSRPPTSNTYLQSNVAGVAGTYTFSRYFKASTANARVGMRISGAYPNRGDALFDLGNGTLVQAIAGGTGTGCTGTIQAVGNGWYRCILTVTLADALQSLIWAPCAPDIAGAGSFEGATGASTADVLVWTGQLEALPYATQPIPTSGAAVTRQRDEFFVPSVVGGGANPCTFMLDCVIPALSSPVSMLMKPFSSDEYGTVQAGGGFSVWNGTVQMNGPVLPLGARHKIVSGSDGAGRVISVDGQAAVTDAGATSVFTGMRLAQSNAGSDTSSPALYIHEFRAYKQRLSNADCVKAST